MEPRIIRLLSFALLWVVLYLSFTADAFLLRPLPIHRCPRESKLLSTLERKSKTASIDSVLHQYGFGKRILTFSQSNLPLTMELYEKGSSVLGKIIAIQAAKVADAEPRVVIDVNGQERTVDIGQITTIWKEGDSPLQNGMTSASSTPKAVQKAWDSLYRARVGLQRGVNKQSLTKKSINRASSGLENPEQGSEVLRKVIKTGAGYCRLVDSQAAVEYLGRHNKRSRQTVDRATVAQWLALDSQSAGRFKRWPCVWLATSNSNSDDDEAEVSILNGGWLILDQSVRASTEGRQFVERHISSNSQNESGIKESESTDARIIRRLECLAMGEVLTNYNEEKSLHVDVRQVLEEMHLPTSPQGAIDALIQTGYWAKDVTSTIEPWSTKVLEAAKWYTGRKTLRDTTRQDLTHLPSLCIDAKGTSFSDDAIGIRSRQSTGRKVDPSVSKWEILVHVSDLSDIYTSSPDDSSLYTLHDAAKRRGTSRYDLPLGPLHLMPPVVLRSRSLCNKEDERECVTVWAYVNEATGQIQEAGVERTTIKSPNRLSYQRASELMSRDDINPKSRDGKLRLMLLVTEKILQRWSRRQININQVARKRQDRMQSRSFNVDFDRSRGHVLVDDSLQLYSSVVSNLMKRRKAPLPIAAGADMKSGGRLATAPLRRYIDGQSQRQILAVLCGKGKPMTFEECRDAGRAANEARNSITNFRAARNARGK